MSRKLRIYSIYASTLVKTRMIYYILSCNSSWIYYCVNRGNSVVWFYHRWGSFKTVYTSFSIVLYGIFLFYCSTVLSVTNMVFIVWGQEGSKEGQVPTIQKILVAFHTEHLLMSSIDKARRRWNYIDETILHFCSVRI